jgi:hypothetical protein
MNHSLFYSLRLLAGVIFTPVSHLKEIGALTQIKPALWAIGFTGAAHGAFSFLLHVDAHTPSFPSLFIPQASHYFWQAILAIPAYFLFWILFSITAHLTLKRVTGVSTWNGTASVTAFALAAPILLIFLLPDLLLYLVAGFDALPQLLRISAPATVFWILWLWVAGIRWLHQATLLKTLLVGLPAFWVGASFMGLFIR